MRVVVEWVLLRFCCDKYQYVPSFLRLELDKFVFACQLRCCAASLEIFAPLPALACAEFLPAPTQSDDILSH